MIRKYHGIESRNSPWVKNAVTAGEKFWTAILIPRIHQKPEVHDLGRADFIMNVLLFVRYPLHEIRY
jgi:hypothetical protein